MSFCTQQVLALASDWYSELGSPSSISIGYVSGWITSSGGMLGQLNTKLSINLTLSGSDPCINGGFGAEEQYIAGILFKAEFYEKQALSALTSMSIPWTNIRDGDSSLTRESATNISKAYMAMHENAQEESRVAVANWKRGATNVAMVDAQSLYSWPSP
jgi:hypothetical protein